MAICVNVGILRIGAGAGAGAEANVVTHGYGQERVLVLYHFNARRIN
jgi:hypothetical protein